MHLFFPWVFIGSQANFKGLQGTRNSHLIQVEAPKSQNLAGLAAALLDGWTEKMGIAY